MANVDDTITRLIGVEVITTGSIITILGLVAWWVVGLGIRPINRMTAAATAIAGGDVAIRVPEADPTTEAGQLGAALNQMLERIEGAFTEQRNSDRRLRRFAADASHELRTPLATVRGYTELYRSGGLASPQALSGAIGRIESETIRMSDLVDELLLLARLDQRRAIEHAEIDLPTMMEELVADARAAEPDHPVDLSIEPDVTVMFGDLGLIRRAIGNVLNNALQHTPSTSRVAVFVGVDSTQVTIEVTDEGPGMSVDTTRHAFERFYRADSSRSRERGGSGLGLAIVREAVEAHGGTVELTSSEKSGTTVRCRVPTQGIAQ
jgi:two-component system OmpR family sensor kinase